jgi:hypothetical protein
MISLSDIKGMSIICNIWLFVNQYLSAYRAIYRELYRDQSMDNLLAQRVSDHVRIADLALFTKGGSVPGRTRF